MRGNLFARAIVVLSVTLASGWALWAYPIRLGLDLRGGTHVVARVEWRQVTDRAEMRGEIVEQTRRVIERRISALGLSEATVQAVNRAGSEDELLIQMPGVDDPEHVKRVIGKAAVLEWRDVKDGPFESRDSAYARFNGVFPLGTELFHAPAHGGWYLLSRSVVIRGSDLRDARAAAGFGGGWVTQFSLSQDAAKRFGPYTEANIGKRAAILLDREILSVAVIEARISDSGQITGMPSEQDAADLALSLRAGSLPASLTYLGDRIVGASLGADSIRKGMQAGAAGLASVATVMCVYYKRFAWNAMVALALNGLILLGALAALGAALTLPGIAGLILIIGMAVDSNVLIFERIREELRAGKAAYAAMDAGFRHAFLTIVDTHVTTMVSCAFLFVFGTSPIKGFAVTLVLGLAANVFTSVFVSRLLFDWELRPARG